MKTQRIQQIFRKKSPSLDVSRIKLKFSLNFSIFTKNVCVHTCAKTRMIDCEVCPQVAHLSLEYTHVAIRGSIRRTQGLFI